MGHNTVSDGTFFPFVLLCQFWFWREMGFGCTYYYVLGVPYSCGVVSVFWFWREIVFGVTYVLSVQYSCAVVSVFCCGGKVSFVPIPYRHDRFSKISGTFFVKKMIFNKTYEKTRNVFLFLNSTLLHNPSLSPFFCLAGKLI